LSIEKVLKKILEKKPNFDFKLLSKRRFGLFKAKKNINKKK
jgi:hypothetical protein